MWCVAVVFLWCVCGELRGKRGALDGDFPALKNMPTF